MVKNITGIVAVLVIIFILYKCAVCASSKGFQTGDIVMISILGVVLVADIILRIKFKDK